MRILFFCVLSIGLLNALYAQSYLGYANQQTDLIDTLNRPIRSITKGDALFVISLDAQFGHYNVVHIKSNKEGFIPRKCISLERVVPQTEDNIFSSIKTSEVKDPVIKIFNSSRIPISVKLNNTIYDINPKERTTIHLKAGKYYYRVSNPAIEPYYGSEEVDEYKLYEWEFYIGDM